MSSVLQSEPVVPFLQIELVSSACGRDCCSFLSRSRSRILQARKGEREVSDEIGAVVGASTSTSNARRRESRTPCLPLEGLLHAGNRLGEQDLLRRHGRLRALAACVEKRNSGVDNEA
jgi:hypothetical protein